MAKAKAKKQTKGKPPKRRIPWFLWLAIAVVIGVIVAFVCIYFINQPSSNSLGEPRAAVIDQLYSLQPNQAFIDETTEILEAYGFEVDIYQGDEITVDLYGRLPSYGYEIIVFRAHAGLLGHQEDSEIVVTRATSLFTNEPYSETKHISEQLNGELARARVAEGYPVVFAIGARFTSIA